MSTETQKQHIYFNALNRIRDLGSVRFRKLLNYFPTLEDAWQASTLELQTAGLEEAVAQRVGSERKNIDPEGEYLRLEKLGIHLLAFTDEDYPRLLKEISHPPALLYIRGQLLPQDSIAVAVVGSRKFSPYGKQVVQDLARDLTRANVTINSGLALGIDALAHQTTIDFSGRTLAVLACGVETIYPSHNRFLAEKIIAEHGAVISELPIDTLPLKHHFPNRNRIISGLSLGTVVIEAGQESGALITAQHALDQNRQVFAIPGSIYNPASFGPNNLLKMGAKPVTSAQDILEDLNLDTQQNTLFKVEILADNPEEQKILDLLSRVPLHFDQIAKQINFSSSTVAATLTIMEMKGKIRNLGGNQYVKTR